MNQGLVLFAFNNGLDYVKLAKDVAKRANTFLNLPVSLVTDTPVDDSALFDKIFYIEDNSVYSKTFHDSDRGTKLPWKNFSRLEVYDITPYQETIVVDVDYVIQSDFLNNCFKLGNDLLLYKNSFNLSGYDSDEFKYINQFSIPFYWATVLYFKKTEFNNIFFQYVRHIRDNWNYYRDLYQIVENKFRNDFAFSIAVHVLCKFNNIEIPGKINYITDMDSLIRLDKDSAAFLLQDSNNDYTVVKTDNTDVHVMNKYSLLRCIS
jgi:hypothetical protein